MGHRPDPNRCGGLGWLERTRGSLTGAERRALLGFVARTQVENLAGRIRLATGRRPPRGSLLDATALAPPDSALTRAALDLADAQPVALRNHSYRSWIYGTALATVDRIDLDPEMFFVAAVLHDAGLVEAVTGECFTLRSGKAAASCFSPGADTNHVDTVRDAISVHVQPGITVERDGALGFFLQAGAMVDITGLRLWDLPPTITAAALDRYDWHDWHADLRTRIASEATAVPDGRFAFLRRCGFGLAMRTAPAEISAG